MSLRFITSDERLEIVRQARWSAEALDRLAANDGPSAADLAHAPILDQCAKVARTAPALAGVVTGHPSIGARRSTITSEVFAFYTKGRWVRTWSRFYRLAAPRFEGRLH